MLIIAGLYAVPYILDVKYILLGFSFSDFVTGVIGTVVFAIQYRRYKELEIREQKDKYVERNQIDGDRKETIELATSEKGMEEITITGT